MESKIIKTILILFILSIVGYYLFSFFDTRELPSKMMVSGNENGTIEKTSYFDFLSPASMSGTPSVGYDYMYYNTYCYHGACAYAEIQSTNLRGESGYGYIDGARRKYYLDEVYVNIKHVGDRFTVLEGQTSWGDPCGSVGCIGENVADDKYVIAEDPVKNPPYVMFMSWDKAYSGSYWAWTAVYWGWVGSDPNFNFYIIDCYDDSDCQDGYYCDKSGTWDTWTEKEDMCVGVDTPNICDGFNLYSQTCDRTTGNLVKDKLIEANSVACDCYYHDDMPNICDGFNLYSQKQEKMCIEGLIKDELIESNSLQCGCVIQEIPNICVDYDLWSQKQEIVCVEGLVLDALIESNNQECGYICTDGETKTFTCTDGTEIITHTCLNNEFVPITDYPSQSCPLNWVNLETILKSYIDELKIFLRR